MSQITIPSRVRAIAVQPGDIESAHVDQEIMQRVTGLLLLSVSLLNSLICTRFVLKLLDANPANVFAQLIYSSTEPFLSVFRDLLQVITLNGSVFEFYDLIAIAVYTMLGWSAVRLLRIL